MSTTNFKPFENGNTPATALLTIEKIPGPIAALGSVKNAFEVFEADFHAFSNISPGSSGRLQKNGNVCFSDIRVVILEADNVPNFAQAIFHGTNLGTVNFYILTTVGDAESQVLMQITLTNARGTSVKLDSIMAPDEELSSLDMDNQTLFENAVGGDISSLVSFSKNYTPPKNYYNVAEVTFAFDEIAIVYTKYESAGETPGKVATSINLKTMTTK